MTLIHHRCDPIYGNGCGKRVLKRLFKCAKLNKVFNADAIGSYYILVKAIGLSHERGTVVKGERSNSRLNKKNITLNLSALTAPRNL